MLRSPRLLVPILALALSVGPLVSATSADSGVKNVILFVGDGMGVATVTAARVLKGERAGLPIPASAVLHMDGAPRGGLLRTHSASAIVTESAAGITALVTGVKVPSGAVSLLEHEWGADTLTTLLEIAEAQGRATGLVTNTRLTHATPAGVYAHCASRAQFEFIATCLLPGVNPALGDGIEVALGGGRQSFTPAPSHGEVGSGRRTDGRDLVMEMEQAGYHVVGTRDELEVAVAAGGPVLGLFSVSHMTYETDRPTTAPQEPSLVEMTRAALEVLSRDPDGFFLLVEGGRIDHALHDGNAYRALEETLEFDAAVGLALELDPEETMILITADHDHTMVIGGYPRHEAGILGIAGMDADGDPYPVLQFGNGPGARDQPDSLTVWASTQPDYLQPAAVHLGSESHGGMDVPLYAFGPQRYLEPIRASMDNTEVFGILRAALGER